MPVDRIQQRPVSRSVRADSVRELRCRHRSRWQTGKARCAAPNGVFTARPLPFRWSWRCGTPPARRTTTDSGHSHILTPMLYSCVSRSTHRIRSKTYPRNGLPKSVIFAQTCQSYWSVTRKTSETIRTHSKS